MGPEGTSWAVTWQPPEARAGFPIHAPTGGGAVTVMPV